MAPRLWMHWVSLAVCAAINLAGVPRLQAQQPFNPLDLPGLSAANNDDPLALSGEFKMYQGNRLGVLYIRAAVQPGWHIYSTTQKPGGPLPSRLKLEAPPGFELARPFVPDHEPHIKPADEFFPVPSEEFSTEVTWSAPFRLADSVDAANLSVAVVYDGLACQESGVCMPIGNVTVAARLAGELGPPPAATLANPRLHATVHGEISPRTVAAGGTIRLTLTAAPAEKYHVYAVADRDPLKVSKPTLIAWKQRFGWAASSPTASQPPLEHPGPGPEEPVQYYHEQPVTWTVELTVPADAAPAGYELRGVVGYQTCTNANCDPPGGAEFSAVIAVVKPGDPVDAGSEPLKFKLGSYAAAAKLAEGATDATTRSAQVPNPTTESPTTKATNPSPARPETPSIAGYDGPLLEIPKLQPTGGIDVQRSTVFVLSTAFLAGFILNFMPCVLPVIGLKIVSFVQQAGHSRGRIFLLNVWYSAGILAVFVVLASLAVFAGFSWGKQFQSAAFNIVLASVVFAFALSFLGVWEISLPGFVGSNGANQAASQEGPLGAFFKGILTTVLATPCSGPLLIPALAWALKQPPALTYTAFVCVGLGMAAPYLVVGAFPRLIAFLPKPGEWMETFKQLMGFVMIGTVVYLLTFVRPPLVVPTVAFLMGLWAAFWWIGRVPTWEELNKRLRVWAFGAAFASLIGLLSFNWLNHVMDSRFQRDVAVAVDAARLDPQRLAPRTVNAAESPELPWKNYSLELLSKLLLEERKVVFVDFTADWCPNCKANERFVLNVAATRSFFADHGIETIKADMTYDSPPIDTLLKQLAGTAAIPVYAVFRPDDPYRPVVMEGILSQAGLLETLSQASDGAAPATVVAIRK